MSVSTSARKPARVVAQNAAVTPSEYDEQRIPFDVVMRKLANTKPPPKTAKPATPKPKKG